MRQGISEPELYGESVYKLKKIVGSNNFSVQFIKISFRYKKIGYNINVLQQTACLVVNPITVGNFAFLFNCVPVDQTSDYDGSDIKTYLLMRWCEPDALVVVRPTGVHLLAFICSDPVLFTVESQSLLYLIFIS